MATRRGRFFLVRVSFLLVVLFVFVLFAIRDVWSRRTRTAWENTLDVAIVLVHAADGARVNDVAVDALRERVPVLEERLAHEMSRHRGHSTMRPFRFHLFGPVVVGSRAPSLEEDGLIALARHALATRSWLREVDPLAGIAPAQFDSRIYVVVRRPTSALRSSVEGQSEQGGRVGIVDVELDETMADLTLFVVAHETMHTLGAEDTYDRTGRARIPEGFVEADRRPLYPQRFAEIMSRNRPVSTSMELVPRSLDELGVGDATARAIRWKP